MKKSELIRTIKYTLIAASAGLIQMGAFAIFESVLHMVYWAGYLISLAFSVIWNFTLNRRYTFKSAANIPVAMLKVLGYYAVFTPLSTLLGNWLAETVGWNGYLVEIICMLLNFITEFLFQRFVVFRNSIDSNDIASKAK